MIHKAAFKRTGERYLFRIVQQSIELGHETYHASWTIPDEETNVACGPFGITLFIMHYTEHGVYRVDMLVGSFISTKGIPILIRPHYIESGPRVPRSLLD